MAEPIKLQRWACVGINRTHQALIRNRLNATLPCDQADPLSMAIEWIDADEKQLELWKRESTWTCLWIGQTFFIETIRKHFEQGKTEQSTERFRSECGSTSRPINLIWSWQEPAFRSQHELAQFQIDGVVDSISRLRSWVESIRAHGRSFDRPLHSLLQGIELPEL